MEVSIRPIQRVQDARRDHEWGPDHVKERSPQLKF